MYASRQIVNAIIVLAVLLVGSAVWFDTVSRHGEESIQSSPRSERSALSRIRPHFTLASIMGTELTLRGAEELRQAGITRDESLNTKLMIVPHHAFVGPMINEAWARLRAGSSPSVIVLVGPNHDNLGTFDVQTTDGIWQTPWGEVETDPDLASALARAGAGLTTEVFERDHSIGVHIPYVAALFPGATIVPIALSSPATRADTDRLITALVPLLPRDAVFVFSIDFSHYLTAREARAKDQETFAWMTDRDIDAARIDAAGADHFDSHAAVNMFLRLRDRLGCEPHVTWYGNSGDIADDPTGETTSYFVWMCDAGSEGTISIHAAGDVMLARKIGPLVSRYGTEDFMFDVGVAMTGAEMRFANLESVISLRGADSGKEISFRALPEMLDALIAGRLNVVSVSNNHALDWGRVAWDDSRERLRAAGILPIGGFTNFETEPVTAPDVPHVAFLGFNTVDRVLTDEVLQAKIKDARATSRVVVVSFHWGEEYQHLPTAEMQRVAHLAIDSGATLVLGHHPHVLQGFEIYNGKLIAYSLGNLVFDQIAPGTHQSVVVRMVIDETGSGSLELKPLEINDGWVTHYAEPEARAKTIADLASWSFGDLKEDLKDGRASW